MNTRPNPRPRRCSWRYGRSKCSQPATHICPRASLAYCADHAKKVSLFAYVTKLAPLLLLSTINSPNYQLAAQTVPVQFSARQFTGAALNRKFTLTPDPATLLQTDGANIITGAPLVFLVPAAGVTTNLWPGLYHVAIDGINKDWQIGIPPLSYMVTNHLSTPLLAVSLTTNLAVYTNGWPTNFPASTTGPATPLPVLFSALNFAGGHDLGRRITITPDPATLLQTDGTNLIAGAPLVLPATGAPTVTNLWPGKYHVAIDGVPLSWAIALPLAWTNAAPAIAVQWSTGLPTYTYTNYSLAGLSAQLAPLGLATTSQLAAATAPLAGTLTNAIATAHNVAAGSLSAGLLVLTNGASIGGSLLLGGGLAADGALGLDGGAITSDGAGHLTALGFWGPVDGTNVSGYVPYAVYAATGPFDASGAAIIAAQNATNRLAAVAFTSNAAGVTNAPWQSSRTALLAAAMAGEYSLTNLVYNQNGTLTNAAVLWPDGTTGVWTATNLNATWLTADGWTLTYPAAGELIAQPAVARDQNGNVTNSPALIISP